MKEVFLNRLRDTIEDSSFCSLWITVIASFFSHVVLQSRRVDPCHLEGRQFSSREELAHDHNNGQHTGIARLLLRSLTLADSW